MKSHFWYNNRQRNGIFFLLLLIIVAQVVYAFVDFSSDENSYEYNNEIALFQKEIDSLKQLEIERRKPKIYPFNPSFITDYKGYKLGMSTQEIDRLLAYRKQGKYINSAKQFQQVTKISDSLLAVLSPHFKFPDWVTNKKLNKPSYKRKSEEKKKSITLQDLNKVSAKDLKKISGIGDKLSARIIKYRNSIKGFQNNEQLKNVYGLSPELVAKVLEQYVVLSKPKIEKININTATFKQVLHLPYINYELTKKIFQYRDEVAEIQDINELKSIDGFPVQDFDKITLYLKAE